MIQKEEQLQKFEGLLMSKEDEALYLSVLILPRH